MTASPGPERRKLRRRRRRNFGEQRVRYNVSMSAEERGRLHKIALDSGRTLSEVLVRSALDSDGSTRMDWRQLAAELMLMRQPLAQVGNNLNQLARHANSTGEFPREAEDLTGTIRAQLDQISAFLDRLDR